MLIKTYAYKKVNRVRQLSMLIKNMLIKRDDAYKNNMLTKTGDAYKRTGGLPSPCPHPTPYRVNYIGTIIKTIGSYKECVKK